MTWQTIQLLALSNLAACLGVAWMCICRLNTQACRVYLALRLRYALLMTGALACGFQPLLFGYTPGEGAVLFAHTVLIALVLNQSRWRRGRWARGVHFRRREDL